MRTAQMKPWEVCDLKPQGSISPKNIFGRNTAPVQRLHSGVSTTAVRAPNPVIQRLGGQRWEMTRAYRKAGRKFRRPQSCSELLFNQFNVPFFLLNENPEQLHVIC